LATILTCRSDFSIPARNIVEGSVVIFPTDTVYGLGTNPRSVKGLESCYSVKKRDRTKKMPVLFEDFSAATKFVRFGRKSEYLASLFWPGKLTMVLHVIDPMLPEPLIGIEKTLAVRVPNHYCSLRLISACGGSLVGTSANLSGEDPLTDPNDERLKELSKSVDYFISESCGANSNLSSTIIDATDEDSIHVIREGAISRQIIQTHLEKMSKTDFS
jgi:L-threonylcarbamoyladenylate synthase